MVHANFGLLDAVQDFISLFHLLRLIDDTGGREGDGRVSANSVRCL
jgi:hypothetical protein